MDIQEKITLEMKVLESRSSTFWGKYGRISPKMIWPCLDKTNRSSIKNTQKQSLTFPWERTEKEEKIAKEKTDNMNYQCH